MASTRNEFLHYALRPTAMKYPANEDPIVRHAVRIMFILYYCHDQGQEQLSFFNDFAFMIESESKIQKLDFWIRYPDHLAMALIRGCDPEGERMLITKAEEIKNFVRQIIKSREPSFRWVPMHRYLRGAYEALDNVMAFLSSRNLAYSRLDRRQTHYYLTLKGSDTVKKMIEECDEVHWYVERCKLIRKFLGHLNGFNMRNMQYLEREYANTPYYKIVERNEAAVRELFERVFGEKI